MRHFVRAIIAFGRFTEPQNNIFLSVGRQDFATKLLVWCRSSATAFRTSSGLQEQHQAVTFAGPILSLTSSLCACDKYMMYVVGLSARGALAYVAIYNPK